MKAVIRIDHDPKWIKKYFNINSTGVLKICNKPLIEYYLDLLYYLEIKEILILSPNYSKELAEYINRKEEWGVDIRYELSKEDESIDKIKLRYSRYFNNGPIFYIMDHVFIHYDLNNIQLKKPYRQQ